MTISKNPNAPKMIAVGLMGLVLAIGLILNPDKFTNFGSSNSNSTVKTDEPVAPPPGGQSTNERNLNATDFTEKDLEYKGQTVRLTKHGRCRMECRELDAYEVQQVLAQGRINPKKTDRNPPKGKCPSVAYEGKTRDGQTARIIIGECDNGPILITAIDLDNKYNCHCD